MDSSQLNNRLKAPLPQSLTELALIVGYPEATILDLASNTHRHYTKRSKKKRDKSGRIRTRRGKPLFRVHHAPSAELKALLVALNSKVFSRIVLAPCVYGVRGRGAIKNAKRHLGKPFRFVTDLVDFFPSISADRIYRTLRSLGFPTEVSRALRDLVTLHGRLPQGAPTSSTVADLIFAETDQKLMGFAESNKLTYSRLVDDLTFSATSDFQYLTIDILDIIRGSGFQISHRKTKYKKGPRVITGPIVGNNRLSPTPAHLERLADPATPEKRRAGLQAYIDQIEKENTIS